MIGLKDETDLVVAVLREGGLGKGGEVGSRRIVISCGIGRVQAAEEVEQGAFAGAGRAAQGEEFASGRR